MRSVRILLGAAGLSDLGRGDWEENKRRARCSPSSPPPTCCSQSTLTHYGLFSQREQCSGLSTFPAGAVDSRGVEAEARSQIHVDEDGREPAALRGQASH